MPALRHLAGYRGLAYAASLWLLVLPCHDASGATTLPASPRPPQTSTLPGSSCQAVGELPRQQYLDQLTGFWLGLSIGNWTGLVTEMDKIGGETGRFYTRHDWGGADLPSIWGQGVPSELSATIDWVLRAPGQHWGSDDDSDIEYIYLQLMKGQQNPLLSAEQIRDGWLAHIYADSDTPHRTATGQPENFLWVSNQQAFDLMQQGLLPPLTGMPPYNPHYDMIDAQLTSEMFGALAPGRADVARSLADLPIRTVASHEAADIAHFYVALHAGAAALPAKIRQQVQPRHQALLQLASQARAALPANQYPARMYDFVLSQYQQGRPWEQVRDALYQRYQLAQQDGYQLSSRQLYCNGCFAAGINFAASLISLFYGEGDMLQTLKIATLAGWDSDNPAATWGGLYGLLLGDNAVRQLFQQPLSGQFDIHRTRKGFANDGKTSFSAMAADMLMVTDRVVQQYMQGRISADGQCYQFAPPAHGGLAAAAANWQLVWQDEFNGTALDPKKWTLEVNCDGGGNQEQQCYTDKPANAVVAAGLLHLIARPAEPGALKPYTSARLNTKGKAEFRYGRIEMRARLPAGQGAWPAFWMLPSQSLYGGWPRSGEIDIMEAVNLKVATPPTPAVAAGHTVETSAVNGAESAAKSAASPDAGNSTVHGTLHYGKAWPNNSYSGAPYPLSAAQHPAATFNTYAIEWQQGEIRWYVNDAHYATQRQSQLSDDQQSLTHQGWFTEVAAANQVPTLRRDQAPFDQPFYLLLNFAVGGHWPENSHQRGIDAQAFAQGNSYLIDYVRVYQCRLNPDTGIGCQTPAHPSVTPTLVKGLAPRPTP